MESKNGVKKYKEHTNTGGCEPGELLGRLVFII